MDDRLKVANLPEEPQTLTVRNSISGKEKQLKIALFRRPARRRAPPGRCPRSSSGEPRHRQPHADAGRRSLGIDQSRARSIWGHYDPETNPLGTRLKAAIEEAGNASTAIGLVGQSASLEPDRFAGVWAFSGTYGAFTPLDVPAGARLSQQNQDSKFRTGVLHILAGHSGPRPRPTRARTSASSRRRCGSCSRATRSSTSASGLQRRGPRLLRRRRDRRPRKKVGVVVIEVARPDFRWPTAARSPTPILGPPPRSLRHPRLRAAEPRHGHVVAQGSSATFTCERAAAIGAGRRQREGHPAISEELFDRQPEAYRNAVLPPEARQDLMFVMSGTRRIGRCAMSAH